MLSYAEFLKIKTQGEVGDGFSPNHLPDFLFDFQKHIVERDTVTEGEQR